jgi:signal transduction histidine kinase
MVRLRLGIEKTLASAKTPEELRAELTSAMVASDEILQMFDAVLRLSEIEGGQRSQGFPSLDLTALTAKTVEFYRPVVEDSGRKLRVEELQPCTVNGNGALLFQLLSNLLENSIIHTPTGTTITIALQVAQNEARLVLRDDGFGIPAPERDKVLQRFYRRDVSRSSPGNGLGLSLVAAIAAAHGGSIVIRDPSNGTSSGVEFVIAMPLLHAASQKPDTRQAAPDSLPTRLAHAAD